MDEPPTPGAPPLNRGKTEEAAHKGAFWRRGPVIIFGTAMLAVLFYVGLGYLADAVTQESTDDAFIDADIVSVAPRVAGQVRKVNARSNDRVKAGDVLVELDPHDLQVQAEEKRAAVASARANVELLKATLDLFRSQIATAEATAKQSAAEATAAQANSDKAQADFKRAEELIANRTISPQEHDAAKAAARSAEANLKSAQEKAASDQSKVAQAQAQLGAGIRAYERAEAQTREAEWNTQAADLNLSYARISAPCAGYVTKKAVEAGNYVQVAQNLMALVPEEFYVTANFKETQLRNIRPGQAVRITIDSLAHNPFAGHVDSIMAGSGARFSLLPPENAVGNFVKVVQRVPVKLVFDEPVVGHGGHVLGPGMSVVPSVHVTHYEIPRAGLAVVALLGAGGLWVMWRRLARRQ